MNVKQVKCYKGTVMSEELEVDISQERQYLHEISNLLIIAQGMSNLVHSALSKKYPDGEIEKELVRLGKVSKSVDRMVVLTKDRRAYLKEQRIKSGEVD